mmetsp:Transcript_13877/g.21591  ORF Transcript_13877/g.21591 Transcript_13877/m.21591 type:complete len:470 (-) Transcript_13877:58-1467(-)
MGKEGYLVKSNTNHKSWKKRHCVIKDGAVHYSKSPGDKVLGQMELKGSKIQNHSDPKRKNCFEIATDKRLYLLVAKSDKERSDWVAALKEEQDRIEGRGQSSSDSGSSSAAATPTASQPTKEETPETPAASTKSDAPPKKEKVTQDDFDKLKVIGQGSFGQVLLVKRKGQDTVYAMKILDKKNIMERNEADHAKTEKNVLQKLVHPFLVNLHYSFQTPDKLYFVMDYVNGGELFFHLQKSRTFDEERTRFYCAQICCGLEYLHENGVLYRDLKPENLLLTGEGHICMTDFGIAKEGLNNEDDRTGTFCGTPEYLAPEVLEGRGYGKGVDWWSFGTLMFEMLTGLPPFYSQDVQKMYSKIMSAKVKYPDTIGPDARDLLEKLLTRDPDERLSDPKKIKEHPFFASIDWDKLVAREITPPFIPPVKDAADIGMIDTEFTNMDVNAVDEGAGGEAGPNFDGFTYVADSELAE